MNKDYNAIWQFDKEESTNISQMMSMSDVHSFIYENNSLIIYLPPIILVADLPEDNIYRIKTKWKGDELYIFPPLGNKWELFAKWDNKRFVMYGINKAKIFKKIKPEEIAKWQEGLLKPGRKMWSYPFINPDDVKI
jgi:hypothetical protein